jgi:XTP/dITP diphosphohydrolase
VIFSQRDTSSVLNPEETGTTFAENARIKAVTWAAFLGIEVCNLGASWVLADDSGLEVDALGRARSGTPPVLRRWMTVVREFSRRRKPGQIAAIDGTGSRGPTGGAVPPRAGAHAGPTGAGADELAAETRFFSGSCEGRIARIPAGGGGFGYDPVFIPKATRCPLRSWGRREESAQSSGPGHWSD